MGPEGVPKLLILLLAKIQDEKMLILRSRSDKPKRWNKIPIEIELSGACRECEHFEERDSKIHNGMLLLGQAYHVWHVSCISQALIRHFTGVSLAYLNHAQAIYSNSI